MSITAVQLSESTGASLPAAANWLDPINATLDAFQIDNPKRIAAFLAQIGHESGGLKWVREIWGPTPAQSGYEGRISLGNTTVGDGFRYRGRGLIQVTGRANYASTRDGLHAFFPDVPDFEASPELLEAPKWAAYSAGLCWASRQLNELADSGSFLTITKRINGGTNGYDQRVALWSKAQSAIGGMA